MSGSASRGRIALRRAVGWGAVLLCATLVTTVSPTAAMSAASRSPAPSVPADHVTGTFPLCGQLTDYTPPSATAGTLTVTGVVGFAPHAFPIAPGTVIDPADDARLTAIAAQDSFTCLRLVAGQAGDVTSVAIQTETRLCGLVSANAGILRLDVRAAGPEEQTTATLTGEAQGIVEGDAALLRLLEALVSRPPLYSGYLSCLDFAMGADGVLSGLDLEHGEPGLPYPLVCGAIEGTAVPFRDPSTHPFPEGETVTIGGFAVSATRFDPMTLSALQVALDVGRDVCLLVEVRDSEVVKAGAIFNTGPFCGAVTYNRSVYLAGTLIPDRLLALERLDPPRGGAPGACADAAAQANQAAVTLSICATVTQIGASSFTLDATTFEIGLPVEADGIVPGERQGVFVNPIVSTDPNAPDQAVALRRTSIPGCPTPGSPGGARQLPDARTGNPGRFGLGWWLGVALICVAIGLLAIGPTRYQAVVRDSDGGDRWSG